MQNLGLGLAFAHHIIPKICGVVYTRGILRDPSLLKDLPLLVTPDKLKLKLHFQCDQMRSCY